MEDWQQVLVEEEARWIETRRKQRTAKIWFLWVLAGIVGWAICVWLVTR